MDFVEHPDFIFKDPSDINDLNESKTRYKSRKIYDDNTLAQMREKLDKDQLVVFETCVNFAMSIKKAKGSTGYSSKPPLPVIQGGTGLGKNFAIETISQHIEEVLRTPGDNSIHPYIIKTAFTDTAAANIKGQTLHHALSFGSANEFFSLSDIDRDGRRAELENLRIEIVDEFSMIKCDMLYQLDLRLKEVKNNQEVPFGEVAVVLFGDILQLRPVRASFVMEEPKNEMFQLAHLIKPLWQMFEVITLQTNHRQGKYHSYAELLHRARIGNLNEEDKYFLQKRVRHPNHPDIPTDALVLTCTNAEMNRIIDAKLSFLSEEEYVIAESSYSETKSQIRPKTDPNGTISGTPLQHELKLKIGAKVIITYNVDT